MCYTVLIDGMAAELEDKVMNRRKFLGLSLLAPIAAKMPWANPAEGAITEIGPMLLPPNSAVTPQPTWPGALFLQTDSAEPGGTLWMATGEPGDKQWVRVNE